MTDVTVSRPFFDDEIDDQTAGVMIVTVVCSVLMMGTLITKILLHQRDRGITWLIDSILYLGAALVLTQTLCVILAITLGLGKHLSDVRPQNLNILEVGPQP